jgi:hypothetical protein
MAEGDNTAPPNKQYTLEQIKERLALLDTQVALNKELLTTTESRSEESKNELTRIQANIQAEKDRLALASKNGEITETQLKTHNKTLETFQKELNLQEKSLDNLQKSVAAGDALSTAFGSYFSILTGVDDTYKNTLLGSMFEALTTTEGMQQSMEKTIQAAKAFPKMALGTLFAQIEQSTIGVFKAMIGLNAELAKATGISGKNFVVGIKATADDLADFGVTIEDAGASLKSLYTNFSNFRNLSESTQETLHTAVTQFSAIGVNADTATDFMDGLTKAFGMTIPQAASLTNQFIGLSSKVKFTAEELMTSFSQLNKDLAAFGKNAPEIFKNLVKQSDALGVSLENLVGVAKQFDTFEGAAESVGKLNTLMGGNFIDMQRIMRMGYDERLEYIREEVKARIGSFDSLNEQQARFVTSAIGYSSVEDAMKHLGDQQVENDKTLSEYGLTQEKMKDLAKDSAGPMKLLSAAMQQLAIDVAPLVKDFTDFVGEIATFIKENKEDIKLFAGIALAMMAIGKALAIIKAGASILKFFGAVGKAAALAAEAIGLTAQATAITAVGGASKAATPGVLGMGAGMMQLAMPILLITAGIVAITYIIAELIKHAIDAKVPLGEMGTAFLEVAAGVAIMAATGIVAAVSMVAMAIGIAAMAAALVFVKTDDLQAMAKIFSSLAALQKGDSPFAKWNESMIEFAKNSLSIKQHLDLVATGLKTINDMEPRGIVPVTQFVKSLSAIDDGSVQGLAQAKELVVALQATTNTDSITALEGIIKEIKGLSTSQANARAARQPIEVVLQIDGHKFGKVIGAYLDKKLQRVSVA